jgi:hypothetical protein
MRRLFQIVGVITIVVVVGIGVGLFYLIRNGSALNTESKAYVDDAIVAIVAHWDKDELLKRTTRHFRENTKRYDVEQLFDAAAAGLGPLVHYDGATGQALMVATAGSGKKISATYVAKASFERGDASVRIVLLKSDATWEIEGFQIDSLSMIKNLAGRKS